ncbi:unnamed protein product [Nesidiocoris tenuis]|uniref:Uncharacterized protein n=1 Tax=Nesidiocoris tenuis TaxID=355587 RepID=A0A6H5H5G0_9HEMI|nr:unnamed protein product [Nesidiocoris tenuis]
MEDVMSSPFSKPFTIRSCRLSSGRSETASPRPLQPSTGPEGDKINEKIQMFQIQLGISAGT